MGTLIERRKVATAYKGRTHAADGFATDATGRLTPHAGEAFEILPLGCLDLYAFISMGSTYQRNPSTAEGMRWEIGFSDKRVSFFSPDCAKQYSSAAKQASYATSGFYYYPELRSLSLGSLRSEGGSYVSMVFVIKNSRLGQLPMGVRVHGVPGSLHAFVMMLVTRLMQNYDHISSRLGVDARELASLFTEVQGYDFETGSQTDLFINAQGNAVRVVKKIVSP
ncbi:MAG: hypothetical protein FWD27_03905 [Coriobacteriia bacterium]|nr:hypothetical protein [Coriobacteriia bacterium]